MTSKDLPPRGLYPCGRPLRETPRPQRLVVLGATGSIGTQTLDVVAAHPERLEVAAVSCRSDLAGLRRWLDRLAGIRPDAPAPAVAVADERPTPRPRVMSG